MGTKLCKVLPGAWLPGRPPRTLALGPGEATGKEMSPLLALGSPQVLPPSGRIWPEVCQVFRQARLSKRRCARSPFRSSGRPGRGKFARGYPGLQRKVPGRRGRHHWPHLPPGADKGRPAPRAQRKRAGGWGMTLETRARDRAAVTPTALPFLFSFD